jgi:hypothetical protein
MERLLSVAESVHRLGIGKIRFFELQRRAQPAASDGGQIQSDDGAYNLVAQVAQLTRITGRRHPMGSIPAKLAITNSSSLGLNHITASLARIFSNLLAN